MIPKRYFDLVFISTMSIAMGAAMSFMMIIMELGVSDDFMRQWLNVFLKSTLVAFPTSLVIGPLAKKFTARIVVSDVASDGER